MARARAYVETANNELFLSRGLKCKILKTKAMMLAVGCGSEVLTLPPLDTDILFAAGSNGGFALDEPRTRRIRALGDCAAELQFEGLPGPGEVEGWWKKLGVKEAQRKDEKMRRALMQSREKGYEGLLRKSREKEEEEMRCNRQIDNLQRERTRMETRLVQADGESLAMLDVEMDIRREMQKLDTEVNKVLQSKERKIGEMEWEQEKEMRDASKREQDIAQKIYWIVIDRVDGFGSTEDDFQSLSSI